MEAASAQSRWEAQMARGRASVLGKGTGSPHECPLRGGGSFECPFLPPSMGYSEQNLLLPTQKCAQDVR